MSSRLALSPHTFIIKNPEHQWEALNSIELLVDTEEQRRVKNRLAQRKHRQQSRAHLQQSEDTQQALPLIDYALQYIKDPLAISTSSHDALTASSQVQGLALPPSVDHPYDPFLSSIGEASLELQVSTAGDSVEMRVSDDEFSSEAAASLVSPVESLIYTSHSSPVPCELNRQPPLSNTSYQNEKHHDRGWSSVSLNHEPDSLRANDEVDVCPNLILEQSISLAAMQDPKACQKRSRSTTLPSSDQITATQLNRPNDCLSDLQPSDHTLLHEAVLANDQGMSNLLVTYGADVLAKDELGRTPLHVAAQSGRLSIVQLLLEHIPATYTIDALYDYADYTPLHLAVRSGHIEVAQKLLDYGGDVNSRFGLSNANALQQVRSAQE